MVNFPVEDPSDQVPVNQHNIPGQFINGFQNWYIVMDQNGQEVIELVESSDDEADPHPEPLPDPLMDAAEGIGGFAAAHSDSEEEDNAILQAMEVIDVGIQVNVQELACYHGAQEVNSDSSDESDMEVDDDGDRQERQSTMGYDSEQPGYCRGCGGHLSSGHDRRGMLNRGRRSRRFYGKGEPCNFLWV